MLRRLSVNQPNEFTFSKVNLKWAKAQLKKYPKGRQASSVIPILWKVQEQEGWV
jgi:NADH-quinone oxidoreductase subunit E